MVSAPCCSRESRAVADPRSGVWVGERSKPCRRRAPRRSEELLSHEMCEEVIVACGEPEAAPGEAAASPRTPSALHRRSAVSSAAEVPEAGGATLLYRGPRLKTGIDVGPILTALNTVTGRMAYRGKVMNRAARVASIASSGQVLCSAEALNAAQGTAGINALHAQILEAQAAVAAALAEANLQHHPHAARSPAAAGGSRGVATPVLSVTGLGSKASHASSMHLSPAALGGAAGSAVSQHHPGLAGGSASGAAPPRPSLTLSSAAGGPHLSSADTATPAGGHSATHEAVGPHAPPPPRGGAQQPAARNSSSRRGPSPAQAALSLDPLAGAGAHGEGWPSAAAVADARHSPGLWGASKPHVVVQAESLGLFQLKGIVERIEVFHCL